MEKENNPTYVSKFYELLDETIGYLIETLEKVNYVDISSTEEPIFISVFSPKYQGIYNIHELLSLELEENEGGAEIPRVVICTSPIGEDTKVEVPLHDLEIIDIARVVDRVNEVLADEKKVTKKEKES